MRAAGFMNSREPAGLTGTGSSAGCTIRQARRGDAVSLADLMTQLGYPTAPESMEARLERILGRNDFRTWLVEAEGSVAGMAGTQLCPTYERDGLVGRLVAFVIDEKRRRLGLGRALLRAVEAGLRELGATRVVVNTATHRAGAHAFYEGMGYTLTGSRFVKSLDSGPSATGRPPQVA